MKNATRWTRKPHGTDRAVRVIKSARSKSGGKGAGDATSGTLHRLGKKVGNTGMGEKLGGSASTRDTLLQFIGARLTVIRRIQLREHSEFTDIREWYRRVAKGTDGYTLPDPTRWHAAAAAFKEAGEAMCRGQLGRGAQKLEEALEHERAAYASVPIMVREEMEAPEKDPGAAPDELGRVNYSSTCPATNLPSELRVANAILNLQDVIQDPPPRRARRRRFWWEEIEDEDEDEDEKKDGEAKTKREEAREREAEGGQREEHANDEEQEQELEGGDRDVDLRLDVALDRDRGRGGDDDDGEVIIYQDGRRFRRRRRRRGNID